MANLVMADESLNDVGTAVITPVSTLPTYDTNLRLFTNNVTVHTNTTLGGLTDAIGVIAGFAAQPLGFSALVFDAVNDLSYSLSLLCVFVSTDPGTFTIYGGFIRNAGLTRLWAAFNFDAPLTVAPATPVVVAQVKWTIESKYKP